MQISNMEDTPIYMPSVTLEEWPVSLSTYKGTEYNTHESAIEGTLMLFINSTSEESTLFCTPWPGKHTKYVIGGSQPDVWFIGLILNSDFTRLQLSLLDRNKKINLRVLRELIIPEVKQLPWSMGGLLESFLMVAAQPIYDPRMEHKHKHLVQPTVDLLTLFQNYFVEELFVPEAYAEYDVSIIEGWYEVNKELPSPKEIEESGNDTISALFETIILKGKRLMRDFNRMKVVQSKTIEASSNKLRHILTSIKNSDG